MKGEGRGERGVTRTFLGLEHLAVTVGRAGLWSGLVPLLQRLLHHTAESITNREVRQTPKKEEEEEIWRASNPTSIKGKFTRAVDRGPSAGVGDVWRWNLPTWITHFFPAIRILAQFASFYAGRSGHGVPP